MSDFCKLLWIVALCFIVTAPMVVYARWLHVAPAKCTTQNAWLTRHPLNRFEVLRETREMLSDDKCPVTQAELRKILVDILTVE